MILESLVLGGLLACGYTVATSEVRLEKRFRKDITKKWFLLMDKTINIKNEIHSDFQLLKIIRKHYGWDAIIGIPNGHSIHELRTLIPKLCLTFDGKVIIEPSGNSAYMRVWWHDAEISQSDNIIFTWNEHFIGDKFRNAKGETYKLTNYKDITSPIDDNDVIGYSYDVEIPTGLKFSDLESESLELGRIFGICKINYDYKNKTTTCEILEKRLEDNTKFKPIPVKPWQLYFGMQHNFKPIIADYSKLPNAMISGRVGSGKTISMIMAFLNIVVNCDPKDYELYIGMVGEKQDLNIFKNCQSTKYYAQDIKNMRKMLKYLLKEMNRRNKLFQSKEMCFNIFRYNSLVSDENKLPIIHFICDEVADLMVDNDIQEKLWDLIRKSRSAGIFITVASQRFSLANISAEIKAQLSNKIMFKMANTASAMTVSSDLSNEIVALPPSREFIADYNEGIAYGKTLELTEKDMIKLMKYKVEKDHQFIELSNEGNIIIPNDDENSAKTTDNSDNSIENHEKPSKNEGKPSPSRWEQMQIVNKKEVNIEGAGD